MHGRRIACLLLGAWLGVGLFLAFAATQNFRTVDAILQAESSPVAPAIGRLGTDQARVLLRYVAGEQNGGYFYAWELFEIGISILLAAVLF